MPKSVQVRLLRVLQDGTITRVGDTKERKVDVRIIAATNKNLNKEITEGRFREDLFYRVAVGVINLPPLRERDGDLTILTDYLLDRINSEANTQPDYKCKKISINGRNVILRHNWPGNIRELYATLLRASLWSDSKEIKEVDIKEAMFEQPIVDKNIFTKDFDKNFNISKIMDEVKVFYIKKAMQESNGSKTKASKLLGLSNYQTLTNWLERYRIQ